MIRFIPYLLLAVTASISEEATAFLKTLHDQTLSEAETKCKNCKSVSMDIPISSQNLMVFMSFSVPLESWKEWSQSLEKMGGVFLLRGLPDNSFQVFAKKVKELRNNGVNAPIYVDPEAFEKYGIQAVPSTVLLNGEKYDKMAGNIRFESVLKSFADK